MKSMSIWYIAFSLFLLMDAVGNIPLFLSILKNVPTKKQRNIIIREMVIALVIIGIFTFIGDGLMHFLHISQSTIQIAGGIVLFIISLKMIFPSHQDPKEGLPSPNEEPFLVPLAVPLIAGPAVLAAVMIYARQEVSPWIVIAAVSIAWLGSLVILVAAPYLQTFLGKKGLIAMERLMGLILILISVQMFLSGVHHFMIHTNTGK
jgi:multiple antibiotic resistance protein